MASRILDFENQTASPIGPGRDRPAFAARRNARNPPEKRTAANGLVAGAARAGCGYFQAKVKGRVKRRCPLPGR